MNIATPNGAYLPVISEIDYGSQLTEESEHQQVDVN